MFKVDKILAKISKKKNTPFEEAVKTIRKHVEKELKQELRGINRITSIDLNRNNSLEHTVWIGDDLDAYKIHIQLDQTGKRL